MSNFTKAAGRTFMVLCGLMMHCLFAFSQTDPGLPGTHTVIKAEYNLGATAYTPPPTIFPYALEIQGSVHYPADINAGPYPVLFFLHGRHETCYDSVTLATSSAWPCTGTKKPIVSYEGYDYAARTMASHGYVVISVSANSINASDGSVASSFQDGMPARGYLLQYHMDLWNSWNTLGGFPGDSTLFMNALDMQHVGTMGHSRGGEGVIYNAELNQSLGSPYGIKAVLTLAPTDFYRHYINHIALLDLAPYCDGDVNDLQGVHYYDDSRYADTTDETPKHMLLMMGANHDFFNTVWTPGSYIAGGADDWLYSYSNTANWCGAGATGTGRFDTTTQKAAYNAYSAAFFRTYVGGETDFKPILEVNNVTPPASSLLDSSQVFVSYHPGRTLRQDINRTDVVGDLTLNSIAGTASDSGLVAYSICGGGLAETACGLSGSAPKEPHKGTTTQAGLSEMKLQWNNTTEWAQNSIPTAYHDLTAYESILFRATVNYNTYTLTAPLNFTVQLVDSFGNTSGQTTHSVSNVLFHEPGTQTGDLPKDLFNTIRIPLAGFSGVDMTKIVSVKFLFDQSAAGAVLISDLAFLGTTCGRLNAAFGSALASGYSYNFTDSTASNYGDTLSYNWNFGDPSTGTGNTSSLANPTHLFSGAGTYTVCLYMQSTRRNGTICMDTFCQTVTVVVPTFVESLTSRNISLHPNPANRNVQVLGTLPGDVFDLLDPIGRSVLHTSLSIPSVELPVSLASGVYYVVITTMDGGKYFNKLVVQR